METYEATGEQKQLPWSRVLIFGCLGCGLFLFLGFVIVAVGGYAWLVNSPEGGVRLSNDMEQYALDYLESKQILEPDEEVLAYYDYTIKLNSEEAAILTNKRVIYHKGLRTTDILLEDIEDIQHQKDGLGGDIIVLMSRTGKVMKIEIAALNHGELFYGVLLNAWNSAQD